MIDGVLLDAVREFWDASQVRSAYEKIFCAYHQRISDVTVIVGKATEGDSASGQVVVRSEDYREWMATLQARMTELAEGDIFQRETVDFSNTCVKF